MTSHGGPRATSSEYVTDVVYPKTFFGELGPAMLRLVAALNGFRPPRADDFDYCELGAGNGVTLATLAASQPGARFVGVDVHPDHVAFASGLIERGDLRNARFLERDFDDLVREDLPAFDYVCLHGVHSWVGPQKRHAIVRFAKERLKPGGLLYVSYNALPGWASVEPMRRLLVDCAANLEGSTLDKARGSLEYARFLRENGAAYFANNPSATAVLDEMSKKDLEYVTHEYFHAHWHPMYFADVAEEMGAADVHFVGQLPLYLNFRVLAIPAPLMGLFKMIQSRFTFETQKDFALNQFFRRDVYIKGRQARDEAASGAYLDDTAFGTLACADAIERSAKFPHNTLNFHGSIFDALIPALVARSASVSELARSPELAGFSRDQISASVRNLAIGGRVVPMLRSAGPAARAEALCVPLAFNRAALAAAPADRVVLASPVAGTGVIVSTEDAASLRACVDAEGATAPVSSGALERFRLERLPKLLQLGVVEAKG
jgi:SAM-dependent methyltransferase